MKPVSFASVLLLSTGLFTTLGLLCSGCGGKSDGPSSGVTPTPVAQTPLPEPPYVAKCEPGVRGGRLVISTIGDPKTFNPITGNESSSSDIQRFLFAGLITVEIPTQEIVPALAYKWSVLPDNKTWTFHLRKGLMWSDGRPLTADDVVFTWDTIYNPNIINVTVDQFRIDGKDFKVTKVDDLTIQVVTPEPYAPFLEFFGSVPIIPKHILNKSVAEKSFVSAYGISTPPEQLVGSGPYKLKQFKPGEFTLMERNPYFWGVDPNGQRLPYIDNIVYTVVPNMDAMSLRFFSGECDVQENVQPHEYNKFKAESASGRFQLLDLGLGLERAFLWFNQNTNRNPATGKPYVATHKSKWFRNKTFRQAISYAIDRESIVKSIYSGRAMPNYGYTSLENKKWNNPGIPKYPLDREKAKSMLAGIGIKDRNGDGLLEDADGNTIEILFNTNTGNNVRDKTAVIIADDLKKIGVKVTYQPIEFNTLVDKINNSYDYECILLGLAGSGSVDPSSGMNVLVSSGFTHQWFPRQTKPSTEWEARIDFLMNEQIKTLDFAQRKKYFDEVQYILADEVPMIYTVAPNVYSAARSDLGNIRASVLSSWRVSWNPEELYFKKK